MHLFVGSRHIDGGVVVLVVEVLEVEVAPGFVVGDVPLVVVVAPGVVVGGGRMVQVVAGRISLQAPISNLSMPVPVTR